MDKVWNERGHHNRQQGNPENHKDILQKLVLKQIGKPKGNGWIFHDTYDLSKGQEKKEKRKKYRRILLMNIDAKILDKMLANWI